ncbi:outer membrane protein [Yoonia sp. I 8.24]|uniref:outer membrane protein n=1 Tax=Yoonia sp. I 8.24 TaxID=1537229 RepID=UPI001EDFFFAA|nr:porin family protein [Yoonia sp. I 8.24]MCG3267573.1 porin family protein [Yoonia sp. I 8.24]
MMNTLKLVRLSMIATPLALAAGMASAGGLSEPVETVAPTPVPVAAPTPMMHDGDWTGFYAGGQIGYGSVESDDLTDDIEGATYGVHGGYMHDFGSWVLGAELDIDGTDAESSADDVEIDSIARAKLRVGYDAGDWLPYFTAGVAQAEVDFAGTDLSDTGSFAGLGAEYRVSDSLRVGGEVLQHQFDDFDGTGFDFDATTVAARVSFQF